MMKKLLFILLLFVGIQTSNAQVTQSERDALISLYTTTNGANWIDKSNWDIDPRSGKRTF